MLTNAEQAAKMLKRSPSLLRKWAKDGKVPGVIKVGAAWVVEFDVWKAVADEVRKPGPKPKGP